MNIGKFALMATATAATTIALAATAHADAPKNLTVTDSVRAQLLQAGAAMKGFPVSDFTGLEAGQTYYAYDPDTATYWAGARLAPSPNSWDANIANQDAGTYTLFEQHQGGPWMAFNDGGSHDPDGCPAPLPASIMTLWDWDAEWCHPKYR